ncbi:MAG: hypothetical protein M3R40_02940, partial [Pseudomonadota bacterium]|nr:hypothetical protein [Pseudomonadota bacterium]
ALSGAALRNLAARKVVVDVLPNPMCRQAATTGCDRIVEVDRKLWAARAKRAAEKNAEAVAAASRQRRRSERTRMLFRSIVDTQFRFTGTVPHRSEPCRIPADKWRFRKRWLSAHLAARVFDSFCPTRCNFFHARRDQRVARTSHP